MNRSLRSMSLVAALLTSSTLSAMGIAEAQVLPKGGQVASGTVSIRNAWWNGVPGEGARYNGMTIVQGSPTAIVNWQDFSIGQDTFVTIKQLNAQAAILNRVTGDTNSVIAGQLAANGQVYLVNPNGVFISRSGQVSAVGGFVASSLDIRDDDFTAGRRRFGSGGGSSPPVTNDGAIFVGRGGYVALIGGQVANGGTISVPLGRVGLGAGTMATLDLSSDGFLQVAAPFSMNAGSAVASNAGTISAEGGMVKLTAVAVRERGRQVVNMSGTIEARSAFGSNGNIILSAGNGDSGEVSVSPGARIDASGQWGRDGGRVAIAAKTVSIDGTVDVSGAKSGLALIMSRESLTMRGTVRASGQDGRIGLLGGMGTLDISSSAHLEVSDNGRVVKTGRTTGN